MTAASLMRFRSGVIRIGRLEFRWSFSLRLAGLTWPNVEVSRPPLQTIKLHFGPGEGWSKPDDAWLALDADPQRGDLIVDFADFERLPFPADSVACVYASHTFEHISLFRIARVFAECHRVLVRGGWIRIVVPDARRSVEEYLKGNERWPLFVRRRARAVRTYGEAYTLFECMKEDFISRSGQEHILGSERLAHQNAWDFESLAASLERAGFTTERIHRRGFRESDCDDFSFEGTYASEANEEERSLYVEAQK
jgi:predicted SAM-dependent methyltransferase